jgi:hypothetical protein
MLEDPSEGKVEEFRNLMACWQHTRTYYLNMAAWIHHFSKLLKFRKKKHVMPFITPFFLVYFIIIRNKACICCFVISRRTYCTKATNNNTFEMVVVCYHVKNYNYHYPHTHKQITQNTLNDASHPNSPPMEPKAP